jgi:hypothetical protein
VKKHNLKSGAGAGFSSQNTSMETSHLTQSEPRRESNRTPRRALGVLVNNGMGQNNGLGTKTNEMASNAGLGSSSKISWPSQAGKNLNQADNSIDSGARIP